MRLRRRWTMDYGRWGKGWLVRGPGRPSSSLLEHAVEPVAAFAEVATAEPEPAEGGGEAKADFDLSRFVGPVEGGAEVVVVGVEPVEPELLLGAPDFGLGGFGQAQEVEGVAAPDVFGLPALGQLLQAILADGFEDREAHVGFGPGLLRGVTAEEAFVHEGEE